MDDEEGQEEEEEEGENEEDGAAAGRPGSSRPQERENKGKSAARLDFSVVKRSYVAAADAGTAERVCLSEGCHHSLMSCAARGPGSSRAAG